MLSALMMTLSLTACRSGRSEVAVKIICPEIRSYGAATLGRALAEYRALPDGSAVRQMLGDYKQLRDRVRACRDAG
jgi:hypothetical protein